MSRGGEELVKPEVKEMLKKAAIRKVQPSQGEFVSNLFLLKKKDVGQRPVINLKQLNAYIPHCDFKMEGLQNLNYVLQKRDYMCKLDLKDAYFSVPLEKKLKAICSLSLVRKLVRVPLPLLWFGTITTNIHKIVKSANHNLTQDKHQNYNLIRRHTIDWSLFRRDTHEPKPSNLPSATSRICHKLENTLTPVQEIEFLDLTINSVTLKLFLNKIKIQKVVSKCQNLLNNLQTSILELTKLIGLLTSNIQAVLPARLNCRFLQMQQISSLSKNLSYLDKIVLNENSNIELKW